MRRTTSFSESFRELGLLVFIVILCVAFQIRNRNFLTIANIQDLLTNTAILGILSVGMMMVLLTGGIDLSIGATIALSGMVSALTVSAVPTPPSSPFWRAWRSGSWWEPSSEC
jgi:rhamnose transport system permease protein